jgi:formylglycine-generating enzyme required for sulfatase activity
MGGNGELDGRPIHEVTVPSFEILKTEVTVAQYRVCVDAEACSRPSRGWSREPGVGEDHPVIYIDWNQAKTFAAFVDARLPSEAEWEYAARNGGQDVTYPWGNDPPTCDANLLNFRSCVGGTVSVCSFPNGNTAQGLCDMLGNVWEWVEDDFQRLYDGAPNDGTARIENPRASDRSTRGGSYGHDELYTGVAVRGVRRVDDGGRYIGFRVARSGPVD